LTDPNILDLADSQIEKWRRGSELWYEDLASSSGGALHPAGMTILKTGQGIANGVYDAARNAVGVLRLAANPDAQQAAVNRIVNDGRALWEDPGAVARSEFDRAVGYLGKTDVPQLWHDSVRGLAAGAVGGTAGPAARIALADGLSLTSAGLRVVGQGIGDVAEALAQKQGFSLGVLPPGSRLAIDSDRVPSSLASDASLPLGSRRLQFNQPKSPEYQRVRNEPAVVGDRSYSGHALDRMQDRGVMPSVVEHAIQNGVATPSRGGHYNFLRFFK